ncbi:hypothetical protein B5F40_12290 [Gordonibacter sp. An230]|uniref:NrfD/PsrC family molybdoenzyme membrane anchor subunit n=1 Tax=Gordonibacter sp. An230 TaxID=1965592 RepID=UPI000B37ED0F|nr:NrfD/PsrC family molybdoenzyme membrane anchor subunit [Gordonibacter sp. An230]OUO88630.1 hypothetical protein B5F40_12290 [Gordonibacter sp. An230]
MKLRKTTGETNEPNEAGETDEPGEPNEPGEANEPDKPGEPDEPGDAGEADGRERVYGPLVIAYLFLGGIAAGGFFAMAAWSLAFERSTSAIGRAPSDADGYRRRTGNAIAAPARNASSISLRCTQAFASLQARMYTLCLLLLALAVALLLWDLGRPERALLVLLHPHATVITFGAFCLVVETALGFLLVLGSLFRLTFAQGRLKRAAEILCCAFSLATMAYTGVFLVGNLAVPFWNTWTIAAVFTCSSLSGGISLLLLADYFIKDQTLLLRAVRPLQKCHLACLATEAASITLFMSVAFGNPNAQGSLDVLFSPGMLATATVGVLGCGLVAPALLETYSLARKECRAVPVSDVLCLFGGLCLRYCVIACGGI